MARNGEKVREGRGHWTNERHVNFLNSMEASFVQSMLQKKGGNGIPPLDRYLPDTSDSTHDLDKCTKPTTRSFLSSSDNVESSGRRRERKNIILACQKSSQDQVVPQFENKGDDEDKDYDKRST